MFLIFVCIVISFIYLEVIYIRNIIREFWNEYYEFYNVEI